LVDLFESRELLLAANFQVRI